MPAKPTHEAIRFGDLPGTFEGLNRAFPLRPIHDDVDLENATEVIDALAGHKLNRDQADYLDSLSTLVHAYEQEHHAVDTSKVTGVDLLKLLMESNELAGSDIARILKVDTSLVSRILSGERSLTVTHMKKLGKRFKLPAGAFVG